MKHLTLYGRGRRMETKQLNPARHPEAHSAVEELMRGAVYAARSTGSLAMLFEV